MTTNKLRNEVFTSLDHTILHLAKNNYNIITVLLYNILLNTLSYHN